MFRWTFGWVIMGIIGLNFSGLVSAREDQHSTTHPDPYPPSIGLYALPASQQPSPLISFGQTLLGRNVVQMNFISTETFPTTGDANNTVVAMNYGFTDNTSLYFNYALTIGRSTTPLNALVQLEHSIYSVGTNKYQAEATVVGSVTLPLHDGLNPQLPVDSSAYGFFLGTTYAWMGTDWYWFASPGFSSYGVNTNHVQPGTEALYEAGLGRLIKASSEKYIFYWLVELDGGYTSKDRASGESLPNTGGNVILLTPSLSFSTRHTTTHLGVSFPVVQYLNGDQSKTNFAVVAGFYWTIT